LKFTFLLLLALAPATASAQNARLRFERLNGLETKARDVVEVNIEGKMLDLAKRVLAKMNDQDARKVGQAISGLQAIYV
jgi:DNA repair exonuclease SbcCD nuclease subunit